MVMLKRAGVGQLLRKVPGRTAKHQAPQETESKAEEEEDFEREPESSEEEELAAVATQVDTPQTMKAGKQSTTTSMAPATLRTAQDIARRNQPTRKSERTSGSRFKDEVAPQAGRKRKSEDISKLDDDEVFASMMSSQPSQAKHKYGGSQSRNGFKPPVRNIHASASPVLSSSPTQADGFKRPNMTTSPRKGSQGQRFAQLPTPPASSPSAASNGPKFRKYDLDTLSEQSELKSSNRNFREPRALPKTRSTNTSSRTPAAVDITSDDDDDAALSDVSSRLSTPPPEAELSDAELAFVATQTESQKDLARCPICQELVDKEALELFTNGNRLGWRDKQTFCESHQRRSAERAWRERGYPNIDWDPRNFQQRMDQHSDELQKILDGKKSSEYRERLERKVETGRIRKVFRDVNEAKKDIVMPGYYGPRGSQIMQAHLLASLNTKLKEMAEAGEALMRAAGAGNFVSSVLVPEVAVLLIREDMKCDDEDRAKAIMEESAEVGKLINPVAEDGEIRIKQEPGTYAR